MTVERSKRRSYFLSLVFITKHWHLDMKNCRGQGYNGVSNMSSCRRGTQALIREKKPWRLCIHTAGAHCLSDLAIVHSCGQPLIRNMLGTFNEVSNFLKSILQAFACRNWERNPRGQQNNIAQLVLNTVGWKVWSIWSFCWALSIYDKSTWSYVKRADVCKSIRGNCLELGHWQQNQGEQSSTCSIQF